MPSVRSTRTVRAVCALAAVGVTTALGLAISAVPAQAANPAWNPADWRLEYTPATSVDGELTVASISNADAKATRVLSFTRAGAPVSYGTVPSANHVQWSPGGDVLATRPTGFSGTGSGEALTVRTVTNASLWSPFGESTVGSVQSGVGAFVQRAQWIGRNRADTLTTAASTDNGAGASTPFGDALVVTVGSTGTRDLAVVETYLPRGSNPAFMPPAGTPTPFGYSEYDAHDAVVSADGTLAFIGTNDKGPVLFVDEGTGPVAVAQLGALCSGQRPAFSPSGTLLAYLSSTADCSQTTLSYIGRGKDNSFVSGEPVVVSTSPSGDAATHFESVSWRARTPAADNRRLGGSDRVATGIAVSRAAWSQGSEGAVIASSESFPDALVGGPLAAAAGVPLLINPKAKLDSRVLSELKRLMPNVANRWVYVVGGSGVVSTTVQKSLADNGFYVVRIAGTDRFATSVAVARELDSQLAGSGVPRSTAFLADGMNFPDALSAGPAASLFLAPTLLTNGKSTPTVVKNYVNGRTAIKTVHAVGGSAASAASYFGKRVGVRAVGTDRYDTSARVAREWFPGAASVGYASGTSFPDALTGGALMANLWEPLMLVQATKAPSVVRSQALAFRAATDRVLTFGGTGVITEAVRADFARLAGTQTALYGPTSPAQSTGLSTRLAAPTNGPSLTAGRNNTAPQGERPTFRSPLDR